MGVVIITEKIGKKAGDVILFMFEDEARDYARKTKNAYAKAAVPSADCVKIRGHYYVLRGANRGECWAA